MSQNLSLVQARGRQRFTGPWVLARVESFSAVHGGPSRGCAKDQKSAA